jgi:glycosyltransferase involved in cell wall biosynthesis
MSTPLSVAVITLNAAASLARCLQSVPWADEILVVDSGSSDATLEIARRVAHRVEHHDWAGYGAQKRYAASLARHDWVLSLDADEWLSPELAASLQALLERGPDRSGYLLNCRNGFMGRWLLHGEGYPDPHLRLFDRRRGNWQERTIHEQVLVQGPVGRLAGDLLHQSAQSLSDYLAKQNRYTQLQAELLHRQGRRAGWSHLVLRPLWRFLRLYLLRRGFLDGIPGLVHIVIGCFNTFSKYAKLRELQGRRAPGPSRAGTQ